MAKSAIQIGPNLALDANILNIFGAQGYSEGNRWIMDVGIGIMAEVEPAPVSSAIIDIINQDIRDGKSDKIHHLLVNPNTALRLFLEGKISRNVILKAKFDQETITFEGIVFTTFGGDHILPVVVMAKPQYAFATIDQDGNVV